MHSRDFFGASALLIGVVFSSAAFSAEAIPADITAAVKNPGRPQLDLYHDAALKPAEVIAFSGIKTGSVVAEIFPDKGYWTRIIGATVGKQTQVYLVVPQVRDEGGKIKDPNQNESYDWLESARAIAYQPEFPNLKVLREPIDTIVSAPKQLDAIILANGYHRLKTGELAKMDGVKSAKGFWRALKSGGVYMVVGATANKGSGFSGANLGRVDPDAVKAEVLAAGFQLDGESNVLARPGDAHTGQADETSDMFVLRFKKPANAPDTDMRTKNIREAMAGYFNYTRRTHPGLIRKGGTQTERERRVMFHTDMTYEEWGQQGSGNNPWQSGEYFFDADNNGCMLHLFPMNQSGFNNCDALLAPPGKKIGDRWCDGGTIREFVGPGYFQFPNKPATEGGTLGDTPEQIARHFGDLYGFAQTECKNQEYANQYLTAYFNYRGTAGLPVATLDQQFSAGYGGKPVPGAIPAANKQD